MVTGILATDMAGHFTLVTHLKTKMSQASAAAAQGGEAASFFGSVGLRAHARGV